MRWDRVRTLAGSTKCESILDARRTPRRGC